MYRIEYQIILICEIISGYNTSKIVGLTHLKYKIKCNRRCGQICILDSWRSNAIGFSFNCVSPRLKCLQRRVTRKIKGSKNRRKAIHKLAKIHELITNQRHDFQHKVSLNLICENQATAVEALNVQGMKKNHKLAQAISDSAWNSFVLKLTYNPNLTDFINWYSIS